MPAPTRSSSLSTGAGDDDATPSGPLLATDLEIARADAVDDATDERECGVADDLWPLSRKRIEGAISRSDLTGISRRRLEAKVRHHVRDASREPVSCLGAADA